MDNEINVFDIPMTKELPVYSKNACVRVCMHACSRPGKEEVAENENNDSTTYLDELLVQHLRLFHRPPHPLPRLPRQKLRRVQRQHPPRPRSEPVSEPCVSALVQRDDPHLVLRPVVVVQPYQSRAVDALYHYLILPAGGWRGGGERGRWYLIHDLQNQKLLNIGSRKSAIPFFFFFFFFFFLNLFIYFNLFLIYF